jgi:polar amino acid transport system ATP-binding protein
VIDWSKPRLKVVGLKKHYGDRVVIDGVNLEVFPGQIVALIGSSGSGKSTLLRCVNLIDELTDGQIFLDGVEISAPGLDEDKIRAQIGLVFQSFNLFSHLSIRQNISFRNCQSLAREDWPWRSRGLLPRQDFRGSAAANRNRKSCIYGSQGSASG